MRINLTKKDLVNSVYMQLGFSKNITEYLINDFFQSIEQNLMIDKKIPIIDLDFSFKFPKCFRF